MNIKEALEYGMKILKENKIDEPILKARILLASILGQNKEYLIIHEKEKINENEEIDYKKDLKEISKKVPIQYITNKQEFMGLEFYVDKNVLIPQPDTEILVEEIINICRERWSHQSKQKTIQQKYKNFRPLYRKRSDRNINFKKRKKL